MPTPPAAHSLLRLLAKQQGRDFDAWVTQLRAAGTSWRAVSNLIADDYGQTISIWTLRRWFATDATADAA